MKEAGHLSLLERQVSAAPTSYQERRSEQSQALAPALLSRSLVVNVLCNCLRRAMADHDPVGAGQARGALIRLAVQSPERQERARRAYHQRIALSSDA